MKPENPKFNTYIRKAIFAELKQFCPFAQKDEFIEITEWVNSEGFDVQISNIQGVKEFRLTWGEYDAMRCLIKKINKM